VSLRGLVMGGLGGDAVLVRSGQTPKSSVVPASLQVSMVVEGCHGNRGLLPSSTSVRLLIFLALPGTDNCELAGSSRGGTVMELIHPRCAGLDVSKRDAKVCVRVAGAGRAAATSTVTTWGAVTNQVLALREHLIAE
jgi:hypothetical protein